jgi:hypothetical protein
VRPEGLGKLKKFSNLIGTRTPVYMTATNYWIIALSISFMLKLKPVPTRLSKGEVSGGYICDRRLLAKLVSTFADRGCHVVSMTDPYGRILGFLDRNRYFFFQVAPQLYSRG